MSFYKENIHSIMSVAQNDFAPLLRQIQIIQGNEQMIKVAYDIIEQIQTKLKLKEQLTCKAGCSFCCHDEITATNYELEYLEKNAKKLGITPNRRRLKKQNRITDFKALSWKDKACSFLGDDGNCTVYEFRPIVCRNHNSIDEVSKCDKRIDPNSFVQEGRNIQTEAVFFALVLLSNNINSPEDLESIHSYFKNKF